MFVPAAFCPTTMLAPRTMRSPPPSIVSKVRPASVRLARSTSPSTRRVRPGATVSTLASGLLARADRAVTVWFERPRSRLPVVTPSPSCRSQPEASAPGTPKTTRPPPITTGPPLPIGAFSVRSPRPNLENRPTPVPKPVATVRLTPLVSSPMPPSSKVSVRVKRSSAKPSPRRSVPPAKTSAPVSPPMASRSGISSTPSLRVVRRAPPPAALTPASTSVPRPDFVRSAALASGEARPTTSVAAPAALLGFWTWKRYSEPPTSRPSSKPPTSIRVAKPAAADGFSVNRKAPLVFVSDWAAPAPVKAKVVAIVFAACRDREFTVRPARPDTPADSDSRVLLVAPAVA